MRERNTANRGDATAPRVSVVVPTFRRPGLLARLVAAFEAQTLPMGRFEVLVVDNGSGDGTGAVLADLAAASSATIRTLHLEVNQGPAAARNLGWQRAAAPIVAFTDDDCVPEPGWLAAGLVALEADDRIGVVQGTTLKPAGPYPYTGWTAFREVTEPTPWFEGCNLFFRRTALDVAGGFDEAIHFGGEDTAAGWAVLAAGWSRAFAGDAVVRHDLVERGVGWHMLMGWREGNLLGVARRFPDLQRHGFWQPWALRPLNVAFAAGAAGTAAAGALRAPVLAPLAWLPWFRMRRPPWSAPRFARYVAERWAVDAAVFAGMKVAAIRHRKLVL